MTTGFVGLTQMDALAQAGNGMGQESETLRAQLMNLIADLEKDKYAVQGSTLASFQVAKANLVERFDELVAFCQATGIDLGEAQQQVTMTDSMSADDVTAAAANLSGVGLAMNVR